MQILIRSSWEIGSQTKQSNPIRYITLENSIATLKLFDLHGRLLMQHQPPVTHGEQTITWPIAPPAAGVYFMELRHGVRKGVVKVVVR